MHLLNIVPNDGEFDANNDYCRDNRLGDRINDLERVNSTFPTRLLLATSWQTCLDDLRYFFYANIIPLMPFHFLPAVSPHSNSPHNTQNCPQTNGQQEDTRDNIYSHENFVIQLKLPEEKSVLRAFLTVQFRNLAKPVPDLETQDCDKDNRVTHAVHPPRTNAWKACRIPLWFEPSERTPYVYWH